MDYKWDVRMLPGGVAEKMLNQSPLKAKIMYFNNDILDPFIQMFRKKTNIVNEK